MVSIDTLVSVDASISDNGDHDVDVATRSLGVRARMVSGIHQGLSEFTRHSGHTDIETGWEKVIVAHLAQIYFGVDSCVRREVTFILRAASPIAPSKQADQPAANSCSGLVPLPALPGDECLMSRRPSSLRDAPPFRPPVVWTLAV